MNPSPASVVIVDDHPLFRRGVVELLNESDVMEVIAEFENATAYLSQVHQLNVDLLLLDLQMPDQSGLAVLQQIRQEYEDLKIIMLTACSDEDKLLTALRYGANGYLQKDTSPDEIIQQLSSALNGNTVLNNQAISTLASHLRETHIAESKHSDDVLSQMTERERETLFLIAKGLNNKLIARQLGISDGTVKVYVKSLLRKLDLHSRLELAAWTHQHLPADQIHQD